MRIGGESVVGVGGIEVVMVLVMGEWCLKDKRKRKLPYQRN